jgi:hypothetical protein
MTTMTVLDSTGATITIEKPLPPGQAMMAASLPVTVASDQGAIACTVSGVSTAASQATMITALNLLHTDLAAALPAGANVIGGVTVADGSDVTTGAKADAAYAGSGAASLVAILKGIYAGIVAAIPAGTNLIGKVGIDQTTPGTTNAVVATGNVASGATDSGNPVKAGGIYNSTAPTLTTGQRGDIQLSSRGVLLANLSNGAGGTLNFANLGADGYSNGNGLPFFGAQGFFFNGTSWDRQRGDVNGSVNQPHAMSSSRWAYAPPSGGITNSTTAVTIMSAAGAGVRNYLTGIQMFAGTLGASTEVAVRDGASGTVLWRGYLSTAGGIVDITFPVPLKGTANTLMELVTLTATITGSVYFNAQGFQGT